RTTPTTSTPCGTTPAATSARTSCARTISGGTGTPDERFVPLDVRGTMRPMKTLALALGSLALLAGCASSPTLPYAPMQQPPAAKITAAYKTAGDTLRTEADPDPRRLEEARIVKADGTDVRPFNIDNPPLVTQPSGSSIGFGIGGISGGGGSAVGSGIGIST